MRSLYVGIHLPESGPVALAALDDAGTLVAGATVDTDDEIATWLEALPGGVAVAAVDTELLVPEGADPPRAAVLAQRLGWTTTATNRGSVDWPACIAVHPDPDLLPLPDHLSATDGQAMRCAHLAWLWHEQPEVLRVRGDREHGYLVTPAPPPAGTELRVEVDPAELETVRAAIRSLPGVRRVMG